MDGVLEQLIDELRTLSIQLSALSSHLGHPDATPEQRLPSAPAVATNEYLTVPEVAKLLRRHENGIYTLAKSGEIPSLKVGGTRLIPTAALAAWLREQQDALKAASGSGDG